MSTIQRLQDELGKLQSVLGEKNRIIEKLGKEIADKTNQLIKLTEGNAVLACANEDLKAKLKEEGITWEEKK